MPNRLNAATSPYLLQHADNPVDWWEWGEEAFAEARRRDVPVFLSVGYAACHWCHVMAHESFEDDATAAQLNADFVCIKVDREERPDVDAVYMEATVAMTGHGGWPMTVVLDHEGSPFFTGTYFPDRPRGGQPALRQVLSALTEAWRDRPDDVRRAAGTVRDHLAREVSLTGAALTADDLDAAVAALASDFDEERGGFGRRPQVPAEHGARVPRRRPDDDSRRMLDAPSPRWPAAGIHDQLAGGFARYSVDAAWVVPHFEKMLYDNAQLVGLYARWGTPLGDRRRGRHRRLDAGGAAHARRWVRLALDADSEGEEGRFYVWTPEQLIDVLGPEDVAGRPDCSRSRHLRARQLHPPASARPRTTGAASTRTTPPAGRARAAGCGRNVTTRSSPPGTAWRSAAWSTPAGCSVVRSTSTPHSGRESSWSACHLVDGRLRRVSRNGRSGARGRARGPWSGRGRLPRAVRCDRRRALARARHRPPRRRAHALPGRRRRLLRHSRGRRETGRPAARPGDNASPSGTSATIHALLAAHALTGDGHWRDAATRRWRACPSWRGGPAVRGLVLAAARRWSAAPGDRGGRPARSRA
jgi:uncharacterized protein YyaL (SSP411 family)